MQYGFLAVASGNFAGIASFVPDTNACKAIHVTAVNAFDDASLLVQDPATRSERQSGLRTEGVTYKGIVLCKGPHVHLPVCNLTESLFCRKRNNDTRNTSLHGAQIFSPSHALLQTHPDPMRVHWKRWTMLGPSGSDGGVDPDHLVDAAMGLDLWRTHAITNDNLSLNMCIIGLEG